MTEPTVDGATRATLPQKSADWRVAALWMGLIPLVLGVGATGIHLASGGLWDGILLVGFFAFLASFAIVPCGLVSLLVHVCRRCPEPDGRHRVRRALLAGTVLLAVFPVAIGCMNLIHRLVETPPITIVNRSPGVLDVNVPWGNDSVLGTKEVTLAPSEEHTTRVSRSTLFPIEVGVVKGPSITVTLPRPGKLSPIRGHRVEWDGTKWVQVR